MQYTPFASDIELPFYTALASHKINHDKLDDSARFVLGLYEIRSTDSENVSCRMQIHANALSSCEAPAGYYRAEGMIKNVNTIEEYRNMDKSRMIHQAGQTIWDAINDGTIYSCPSLLSSFVILSFADLKKYKFSYWFAFPALHSDPSWIPVKSIGSSNDDMTKAEKGESLSSQESAMLVDAVQTWSYGVDGRQHGFFLARREPKTSSNATRTKWTIASLSEYENGFFTGTAPENRYVCFADPSNYDSAPGWMLRNLLVVVKQRWGLDQVQILRYRDVPSRRDQSRSIVIRLESKQTADNESGDRQTQMPRITGWERNPVGKLSGRTVNLTEYMDPSRLADQSVDLNLKLMKWRISPTLDLDKIKNTKCLLLGAGTLGSYVARNLLGWGVKKITFVDKGTVSFSNPVRQPLFTFADCLNGGVSKAHRASQALKEIYPGVDSKGHLLSVPMAGHPIIDEEVTRREFVALQELIDQHDAIFLLMDTRESRWLPTLIGKASGKIVMNAALGFDSFVVMRHGVAEPKDPLKELGCYFCNDVVAPANSIKDQTLDQQCTVTRPGVAAIASALLVELLVSILQHPEGVAAPAPLTQRNDREDDHPLGLVPHQIRGFLATFENITVTGKSYACCSACSEKVTRAYQEQGWDFVRKALNEPGYVEELSGLKEVHEKAEAALADIEWDEASENEDVEIL
ncbi:Ubiquitin-like modifier-activating enzyme atg7 [Penicillium macrosclerotiorum]|uniref:Ubiquitin-like modifier-activating enzyme atg7 n=1 Tax=Penicillium macrosclerotiorum TaxID=303699 RepID=UPI002546F786|nr:Ubiquitin-like modifier-activating enzyme atg7 [Penicillium macrosclerotiorum]KAJ5668798.1 Ubiquitin-like modifier-activating enzyme atg7 [Penicillium macrosclerotiorum]